jgi:hypothetical protein
MFIRMSNQKQQSIWARLFGRVQHISSTSQTFIVEETNPAAKSNKFVGNPYRSYAQQVRVTSDMYEAKAEWGSQATKNIIDVRSSFIMGGGVQPRLKSTAKESKTEPRELEFIKNFININDIAGQTGLEWAKECEIEGKFLCRLSVDTTSRQIVVRFIPWTDTSYKVSTRPDDYQDYTSVTMTVNGREVTIPSSRFVYAKFGGRTHKVNETPTKIGSVLSKIEALDRALRDLREINHLFASPTPTFECEDSISADDLYDRLLQLNWKIGKLLVIGGCKYTMVGPPESSVKSLTEEITTNAKIISGATGVPVHFFGFSDLMSNRATADSLMEMVFSSTEQERATWKRFYTTLFYKAIVLYNETYSDNMDPELVEAEIPHSSQTKMRQIIDFWLELKDRDAVSLQTVLEQVPNIDAQQELGRLDREREKALDEMAASLTTIPHNKRQNGEERRMEKVLGPQS